MNILILTAGFGEGHNTAARNLRDALQQTGEAHPEIVDVFAISYGRFNEFARRSYLAIINHAPAVWGKIYNLFDSEGSVENNLRALSRMKHKLKEVLDRQQPRVILSTYPLYSFLIEQIYRDSQQKRVPLITIVTDSITINSIWYRAPSDFYVVPNDATATVMEEGGVPASKIRRDGFPVTLRFDVPFTRKPPSDEHGRRVLLMINFGRREAPQLVRELLKVPDISLTVTVGQQEDLRRAVEAAAKESGRAIDVLGWTDKMPDLMMSHHLLLSKAGGATVQESLAARIPMVISQIVPGQEEGNARLLLENNCGCLAESPLAIAEAVRSAFADDAKKWRTWAANVERLSRPAASRTIARFALEQATLSK